MWNLTKRAGVVWALGVAALAAACGGAAQTADAPAAAEDPIVLRFNGEPIRESEIVQTAPNDFKTLEQQRYEMLLETANRVVNERMIVAESQERGLTPQQLLETDVLPRVPVPTEEEIRAYYERLKSAAGGRSLEELRERIVFALRQRQMEQEQAKYVQQLRAKHMVEVVAEPPRFEIALLTDDLLRGSAEAPVTLVEFADFECPFCRTVYPTIERVREEYGEKLRYVFRDFPLPNHPHAVPASEAARCAEEQGKFWEYFDNLMTVEGSLDAADLAKRAQSVGLDRDAFKACVESRRYSSKVRAAYESAVKLGINATPTAFINGRKIVGAPTYEELKRVIEQELVRREFGG